MHWYLVKTKARQEFRAREHLENQSFRTYLPVLTRKSGKDEALFPGYIFLAASDSEEALGVVRSTRGVLGFVRFGEELATASEALIDDLRMLEAHFRDVPRFLPGQELLCKSGPFAGLRAIFECESGEERCIVLMNILNSPRAVRVKLSDLEPA